MFTNAVVNFLLHHIPRSRWHTLSSLCTLFSRPTITSPISFDFKGFSLVEFPAGGIPNPFYQRFLSFCYPSTLANREEQIENDRRCYWKDASTFLVFNSDEDILGCVQTIFRNDSLFLPVEYANITDKRGEQKLFNITPLLEKSNGPITEIYRCRRSFDLTKMQTFYVLMMLFKAVWIKACQTNSSYSLISFDPAHQELRSLYLKKLDFTDPDITLTYGRSQKKWSLLVKDWEAHKKEYISKGMLQFYMQTWGNMNVRKSLLKPKHGCHQAAAADVNSILFTQTVRAKKKNTRTKTEQRSRKKVIVRKEE